MVSKVKAAGGANVNSGRIFVGACNLFADHFIRSHTQFFAVLACCSVASASAGLLPQFGHDGHQQYNRQTTAHRLHTQREEHPLQKLSAGYETPPHQYQVDEKEHHHHNHHYQPFRQQPSAYTVATTIPRRQQYQQPTAPAGDHRDSSKLIEYEATPIQVQHIKTIKYFDTTQATTPPSAPPHNYHKLQHHQNQLNSIQYTVQPSQTLAIFHGPSIYETLQNHPQSHFAKTATIYATQQPQDQHQQSQQHYQTTPVTSTPYRQNHHQFVTPTVPHHPQEIDAPKYIFSQQPTTNAHHEIVVSSQSHHNNNPVSQNVVPHVRHTQTDYQQLRPPQASSLHQPQRLLHVPQYEHNVQQHSATTPDDVHYQHNVPQPSRGLSAPTVPLHVNAPPQQTQAIYPQHSHHDDDFAGISRLSQGVYSPKVVGYSPAEAVSHTSFKSSDAHYEW